MFEKKFNDKEKFLISVLTHIDFLDCNKIKSLFTSIGSNSLYLACKENKIDSIAADSLIKCLGKKNLSSEWINSFSKEDIRIKSYMDELENVAKYFLKHGIDLIALKNSGITKGIYKRCAASPMGDIDVLVQKKDFMAAHELLLAKGYKLKFRSKLEKDDIEEAFLGGGSEYYTILKDGEKLWFELQWRSVAGRWITPDQEPSTDELFSRSKRIKGSAVRLLSPEDNLLQVCLHTAKHSFVRAPGFRLNTDVDRIVRESSVDWKKFESMVSDMKVKTPVFFSLKIAKELVRTPIPENILNALSPSRVKILIVSKWLTRVGIFDPDGKKWTKIGYIIFVSLLYDSIFDFLDSIFPDKKWMIDRYKVRFSILLPFYYILRITNLLFKRTLNSKTSKKNN